MFADDYVFLKIDVEAMENGKETAMKLRGGEAGGIPWCVILDGNGKELANSDGPDGNVGCPITPEECAYFVSMIEKTVQNSPDGRVKEITDALEMFAKPKRTPKK